MSDLSVFSVYTMRHSSALDAEADGKGQHVLNERKAWVTGQVLWAAAHRSGELMPVIFSPAEDDTGLIYWAHIDDIEITGTGDSRTTTCAYSDLKPIRPSRPKSSLVLKSTGRPLSDNYIRPYAICYTPDFLV